MRDLLYEIRPFLYFGISFLALATDHSSKWGTAAAVALLFCSLMILNWRFQHRGLLKDNHPRR